MRHLWHQTMPPACFSFHLSTYTSDVTHRVCFINCMFFISHIARSSHVACSVHTACCSFHLYICPSNMIDRMCLTDCRFFISHMACISHVACLLHTVYFAFLLCTYASGVIYRTSFINCMFFISHIAYFSHLACFFYIPHDFHFTCVHVHEMCYIVRVSQIACLSFHILHVLTYCMFLISPVYIYPRRDRSHVSHKLPVFRFTYCTLFAYLHTLYEFHFTFVHILQM